MTPFHTRRPKLHPERGPSVFFTNAEVDQAGQFGGTPKMQGLHDFIGD
ncbi:hypothetical protein [Streptomyces sp. NPDC052036]